MGTMQLDLTQGAAPVPAGLRIGGDPTRSVLRILAHEGPGRDALGHITGELPGIRAMGGAQFTHDQWRIFPGRGLEQRSPDPAPLYEIVVQVTGSDHAAAATRLASCIRHLEGRASPGAWCSAFLDTDGNGAGFVRLQRKHIPMIVHRAAGTLDA